MKEDDSKRRARRVNSPASNLKAHDEEMPGGLDVVACVQAHASGLELG